jgi:phospholipid/cholesterol/gamma-HCH transport system permease protein
MATTTRASGPLTSERLRKAPGYARLEAAGGMGTLLIRLVRAFFTRPYSWIGDCVEECNSIVRRAVVPLVLSMSAFAIGTIVALIGGIVVQIGAVDRAGGANITGWPREPGFWVTSMIVAGVAGSALTADLGARRIRDEIDALSVLGVDVRRQLILPRVVAFVIMTPILGLVAVLNGMGLSYLLWPVLLPDLTRSAFIDGLSAFANVSDIISFVGRCMLTGLFIGVVCSYKGLATKGGAEGVGRAVNEAVLITFFGLWLLNDLWNIVFLSSFPSLQVLRG